MLKVHAELQGIAKPTEVSKLLEKHYDAKQLGVSLLGSIIDKLVHTRKSTDNFKQILSNEQVLQLINAALDVVKPGTKHYTDKEVDKIIKEYGSNITSIQKDVKEAIIKRETGLPFEGVKEVSLEYTEADKGGSKDLATEMVAEKKEIKAKVKKGVVAVMNLEKTKTDFDTEALKHNYTQAQALAVVAKDIRDESYYPEKAKVPKLTKISEIVDTTPKPAHIKQEAVNKMAGANEVLKKLDHQVQQHKVSLNYNKPTDLTDVLKKLGY